MSAYFSLIAASNGGTCQPVLDSGFTDNVHLLLAPVGRSVGSFTVPADTCTPWVSVIGLIETAAGGMGTRVRPRVKRSGWHAYCASSARMVMLAVVPREVVATPADGMNEIGETARIIRLVLLRLEGTLTERMVVGDPWAAMACGDPEFTHEIEVGRGDHGRAPILMDRELPGGHS